MIYLAENMTVDGTATVEQVDRAGPAVAPAGSTVTKIRGTLLSMRWLMALSMVLLVGCGKYDHLSDRGYDLTIALYGAVQNRNLDRVESVARLLESDHDATTISATEHELINSFVEMARNGDWKKAADRLRRLLKDQSNE